MNPALLVYFGLGSAILILLYTTRNDPFINRVERTVAEELDRFGHDLTNVGGIILRGFAY